MKLRALLLIALFLVPFGASASVLTGSSASIQLTKGLVGWWTLDGKDTNWGTNKTNDVSGGGINGTMTSMSTTTSPVPGKIGQGLIFNGTTQYIDTNSGTSVLDASQNITISAWVYVTSCGSFPTIAAKSSVFNEAGSKYAFYLSGGTCRPAFSLGGGGTAATGNLGNVIPFNTWQHVVVTNSAASWNIYQNGVLTKTAAGVSAPVSSSDSWQIGRFVTNNGLWAGSLDDVRIYNRALSQQEITALHNSGSALVSHSNAQVTPGLIGYWTFDGKDTSWGTNKTNDLSGNAGTGTLTSFSTTTSPIAGVIGQALKFDGATTHIDMGTQASLSIPSTSDYTVSMWLKTNVINTSIQYIMGDLASSGAAGQWAVDMNRTSGKFDIIDADATQVRATSNTAIVANKWYHVVFRVTAAGVYSFFLNGVADGVTTTTRSGGTQSGIEIGRPGHYSSGFYFNGSLDDVRIYNRALSTQEIQALYKSGQVTIAHSNAYNSNGLIGYWTFDGKDTNWNTNTTNDISGSANTGTMTGMSTTTSPIPGKIGQALTFNGSTSHVNAPGTTQTALTVTGWIKARSFTNAYSGVFGFDVLGQAHFAILLLKSNGKLAPYAFTTVNVFYDGTGTNTLSTNKWYMLTMTYDSTGIKGYVNGVLDGSTANSGGALTTAGTSFGIGYDPGASTREFDGVVDDVRAYNRALSQQEITALYNATR